MSFKEHFDQQREEYRRFLEHLNRAALEVEFNRQWSNGSRWRAYEVVGEAKRRGVLDAVEAKTWHERIVGPDWFGVR